MSMMLTLSSLRGGSGTTSVCAALGDALQSLGKKVLLIDLNPNDMLRLHFNVPFSDYAGWAWATTQQKDWKDYSYAITPHLHLIAYGSQGVKALSNDTAFSFPFHELATISNTFDVILIDCPTSQRQTVLTACPTALELLVTNPDPATHILLSENTPQPQQHLLINGLDPAFTLSNLLLLEWRARFPTHLIPTFLHRDNGFPESLAQKMPVTQWRPHSAAARDAHALAKWCLTQVEGAHTHA